MKKFGQNQSAIQNTIDLNMVETERRNWECELANVRSRIAELTEREKKLLDDIDDCSCFLKAAKKYQEVDPTKPPTLAVVGKAQTTNGKNNWPTTTQKGPSRNDRTPLINACIGYLKKSEFLKASAIRDLLIRDGFIGAWGGNENYVSALLSPNDKFVPDRKRGWSLKSNT